eukprot:6260171-Prymnesium_polylepis.3
MKAAKASACRAATAASLSPMSLAKDVVVHLRVADDAEALQPCRPRVFVPKAKLRLHERRISNQREP